MDQELRELLEVVFKISEEKIKLFEEQEVLTVQSFNILEESDFTEIFPKVGSRRPFLNKFKEYKTQAAQATIETASETTIGHAVYTILGATESNVVPLVSNPSDSLQVPLVSNNRIEFSPYSLDISQPGPSYQYPQTTSINSSFENSSCSSANSYIEPLSPVSSQSQLVNIYEPNFVKKCLIKKFDGQSALEFAKANNGCLRDGHRTSISVILINSILEPYPQRHISVADLTYLANEICKIFPGEKNPEVYYERPIPNVHKNGSGTLYAAIQSARKKKKRSCSVAGSNKKKVTQEPAEKDIQGTLQISDPEVLANIEYLKNTVSDLTSVEYLWEVTHDERIKEIYKPGNVVDYLHQFPSLRLLDGYKLLLVDFRKLYPEVKQTLSASVDRLKENILTLLKEKLESSRDADCKTNIRNTLALIPPTDLSSTVSIRSDPKSVAAIYLLPQLIAIPPSKAKKAEKYWKPSRSEVQDGFITHVKASSQIEQIKHLVAEHNHLYKDLTQTSLKPKHHFMTHYGGMIKKFGPLTQTWTMRFEARHKID
ncbi:hypothetical protein M8J77_022137 [Diaphorina citri]|nr:hypothetical protein M8J77_022137 [Diaphorina citri]